MNDQLLILIVLLVSGLTLCCLLFLAFYLFRLRRIHRNSSLISLTQISSGDSKELISSGISATTIRDNVLTRLSFRESMDITHFATASQESAISHLTQTVAGRLGDGVEVVISSLNLAESWATMVVSASKNGEAMLRDGTATIAYHTSGKRLPMLRDVATGQWIENMKEAKAAAALAKLSSLTTIIVGAAHIISGADIAIRLKSMDAKIDQLLAYREIDQMSALERIYTSARELYADSWRSEKNMEIWRLRGELRELRIRWRRELKHRLALIEDPNQASFFQSMFKWIEPVDKGVHRKVHEKITEGQLHIYLIEYSLRLDQALAATSDMIPEFELTLAGELQELSAVAELLESKGSLISKKYSDLSVAPTVEGIKMVVEEYKKLLPLSLDN